MWIYCVFFGLFIFGIVSSVIMDQIFGLDFGWRVAINLTAAIGFVFLLNHYSKKLE